MKYKENVVINSVIVIVTIAVVSYVIFQYHYYLWNIARGNNIVTQLYCDPSATTTDCTKIPPASTTANGPDLTQEIITFGTTTDDGYRGDDRIYITGTGKEIYKVKGYYNKYEMSFPVDYDPKYDTYSNKIFTCEGFTITEGDSKFINAYKTLKAFIIPLNGKVTINLNYGFYQDSAIPTSDSLRKFITSSTVSEPITLAIKLNEFPGREVIPCDNYGIKIFSASAE
jgi:hypothetical protein